MLAAVSQGGATEVVAVATVFAAIVTKVVDMLRNAFDKGGTAPKWIWNVSSLALGMGMAVAWRVNILDNYSSTNSVVQGVFGQILSGLAIGGAASGYHELFDALSSTAKKLNPPVTNETLLAATPPAAAPPSPGVTAAVAGNGGGFPTIIDAPPKPNETPPASPLPVDG
jgi:hypothetical protein